MNNRRRHDHIWRYFSSAAALFCAGILGLLLGLLAWNGAHAINLDFLLMPSRDFGAAGGILYQMIGSLLLIGCAALISFPIALGTALYKSEYLHNPFWQKATHLLLYGLNGVPSVIFGVFGLIFFVNLLGTGLSWFVGSIILAIMILPTITLSAYQTLNGIPSIYRQSARALGLSQWQVILSVVIPQGCGGAFTGLFIGLARAIGETAPIMFIAAAFSGTELPGSLFEPVVTLPTHILALAQQATDPQALHNAWGAGCVLFIFVIIFSYLALWARRRLTL